MQRKWLLIVGVVAAVAVALALGVSANTLLIVGALLLCRAALDRDRRAKHAIDARSRLSKLKGRGRVRAEEVR